MNPGLATKETAIYSLFADMLTYPQEDVNAMARECIEMLPGEPAYPEVVTEELKKFHEKASVMPLEELQQLYSYTFEFSADHSLDLSHHLFEGFKRSNHLVDIKEMYKAHDFPFDEVAKGELPDNLPVMLRFLASVKDEKTKKDLRESFLIKALEKLGKNIEKVKDNIYKHVVTALIAVVDKDVKEA